MGDRDKSINNELRSCCVCTIWSSRVLVASRIAISSSLDTLSLFVAGNILSVVLPLKINQSNSDYLEIDPYLKVDRVLIFDSFVVTFTSLILLSTSLAWIYLTVDSPLPLSIVGLCYILSSEEYLVYFVIIAGLFFMNTVSRILPFITSQASGFLPLNQFKSVSISIDVKEITSGSVPTTNISLHRDFLPLIVLFVLQVSPLNQFKFDLFERLLLVSRSEVMFVVYCYVGLDRSWCDI